MSFPSTPIAKLTGHNGIVHAVAYSSGTQSYILTGSSDRTIRLYNPKNAPPNSTAPTPSSQQQQRPPGLVNKYTAHGYEVLSIDVNAANDKFVSTGGDKTVFLWDVQTAQTVRRWTGHAGRVNRGVFGGEADSVIVTGSFDGTVRVWDVRSNAYKPIMLFSHAKDSVSDVAVHDAEIVAASVDGRVRSYDLRSGMCQVDVIGPPCTSIAVSNKGTEVLLSSLDSSVRLMDRVNGELLKSYKDDAFVNTELRVRSTLGLNDSVVVSGSDHGMVFAWDMLEGTCLHRFKHSDMREVRGAVSSTQARGKKDVVSAVAFCQTRREWCSGGGDGNVVVWGMGS
ncbi:mitogen-activated protein kinase organizer 1 [Stemphylium lycopersici]|uniref:Mitogen-activated protein kinase organizer 1 n=1 Tax=Stemphylium lycopersici TaxID=183478 RepID=A0A364MUL2_STELY|nr:mitogen-activated protein kinase organizer 1 [Stemphylium lycopersici]RAR04010.1 mitogen-activated protein kinase organizer 1 [Stemphylium lycopersici]